MHYPPNSPTSPFFNYNTLSIIFLSQSTYGRFSHMDRKNSLGKDTPPTPLAPLASMPNTGGEAMQPHRYPAHLD